MGKQSKAKHAQIDTTHEGTLDTGAVLAKAADVAAVAVAHRPGSIADLIDSLASQGIKPKHEGGSLPLLKFTTEGDAYVVRFVARGESAHEDPTERFPILTFDVIDFDAATRGDFSRVAFRAEMPEGAALARVKWDGAGVYAITYGGTLPSKAGRTPMKLYAVHRLA